MTKNNDELRNEIASYLPVMNILNEKTGFYVGNLDHEKADEIIKTVRAHDSGWIPVERFMDEIDADRAGFEWLSSYTDNSDELQTISHVGEGGQTSIMLKSNKPVAMYTIIRDMMNWSILIKHAPPESNLSTKEDKDR